MSYSSSKHKNRVKTYPTLRRDIDGLFPVEAGEFDPIKNRRSDLFKFPRFNIVLPDLGRYAVRELGLDEAVKRVEKFKTGLPDTITFGISDLEIVQNGRYFQVNMQPDEPTSTKLNEERMGASNALKSLRAIRFYNVQIANLTSIESAELLVNGIEEYLSLEENNLFFDMQPPVMQIKGV